MTRQTEYTIIRFLDQGSNCYKINDLVQGTTLIQYVKQGKIIKKQQMYEWFAMLVRQLRNYYKSEEVYGYVNPCTIVISEEDQVYLLDIHAKENEELLKRMQKKSFRMLFIREEQILEQEMERADDIYGLGKVMQFVMAKATFEKEFTIWERKRMLLLIRRCVTNRMKEEVWLEKIQKKLELMKGGSVDSNNKKKKVLVWSILLLCVIGGSLSLKNKTKPVQKEMGSLEVENRESAGFKMEEKIRAYLELGILYFSDVGDYVKARKSLEQIRQESTLAEIYLNMIDYLQNGEEPEMERWAYYWEKGCEEWERLGLQNQIKYKIPFFEVYKMKNTMESWEQIRHLGEEVEEKQMWEGQINEEKRIRTYLGEAYVRLEENELALSEYEKLKEIEFDRKELERIYLKILFVLGKMEDTGSGKIEEMMEEALQRIPQIGEHPEFVKIQQSYPQKKQEEETQILQ